MAAMRCRTGDEGQIFCSVTRRIDGDLQRHRCASDGGGAGASIGLQHMASPG